MKKKQKKQTTKQNETEREKRHWNLQIRQYVVNELFRAFVVSMNSPC